MHDLTDFRIQMALISLWDELKVCMERINSAAQLYPKDGYQIFKHIVQPDKAVTLFNIENIVFNLPERATALKTDLYVVLRGRLFIDRDHYAKTKNVRTLSFDTEAGYFRMQSGDKVVVHVYGAHYDFSKDVSGHPVFHAQMKSFGHFHQVIKTTLDMENLECKDYMRTVLKTVRLPTAQMDVFSFFLQLIADHLIGSKSSETELDEFARLIEKDKNLQGAGSLVKRLQGPPASVCYRASHWYPPELSTAE